jgi:hypothetical protein
MIELGNKKTIQPKIFGRMVYNFKIRFRIR